MRTHMLYAAKQANDQPKPLSVPPRSLIYFEEKFPQTRFPSSWQRASGGKPLGRRRKGVILSNSVRTAVLIAPLRLNLKTLS